VVALAANPNDENQLLVGYQEGQLVLWDFVKTIQVNSFSVPGTKSLTCVAWHSTGNEIAAGFSDGELAFWNVRTSDLLLKTYGADSLLLLLAAPLPLPLPLPLAFLSHRPQTESLRLF